MANRRSVRKAAREPRKKKAHARAAKRESTTKILALAELDIDKQIRDLRRMVYVLLVVNLATFAFVVGVLLRYALD